MTRPAFSERVYALLLRLLPEEMRSGFGGDMRDVFRDHLRYARSRSGWRGVLLLWLRTVPDLVYTAIHEREDAMLNAVGQDARYAVRMLRKHPVFTFVAVAVVALGTGAVSTIYSVANAVVLRPVPGVTHPPTSSPSNARAPMVAVRARHHIRTMSISQRTRMR